MSYVEKTDPLWQFLERIVADEGLCLYDAEQLGTAGIRVTIDVAGKEAKQPEEGEERSLPPAVSSGDCSRVCRRLMVQLQVEGPALGLSEEPQIDVSSPGINRELRKLEHFAGAVGERVKVVLDSESRKPLEGKAPKDKKAGGAVIGVLDSFEDEALTIIEERTNESVMLPLGQIRKANVAYRF